jgi:hypothetical protein
MSSSEPNVLTSDSSNAFARAQPSSGLSKLKLSKSSDELLSREDATGVSSGVVDRQASEHFRLSHVSEESSNVSVGGSSWIPAIGYEGPSMAEASHTSSHGAGSDFLPALYPEPLNPRSFGMGEGRVTRFGNVDLILAQDDGDSKLTKGGDDNDWETIQESRSLSNVEGQDADAGQILKTGSVHGASESDLSLANAPVSTWDPLSNKSQRLHRSEQGLEEALKSQTHTTRKGKEVVGRSTGANDTNTPTLVAPTADTGTRSTKLPEDSVNVLPQTTQVGQSHLEPHHTARPRYQHPTPLQHQHNNPFTTNKPVLHPISKRYSTPSTSATASTKPPCDMYNLKNRNLESGSSLGEAGSTTSMESAEERARRLRRESIEAEIALYDPGKTDFYQTIICDLLLTSPTTRPSSSPPSVPRSPLDQR